MVGQIGCDKVLTKRKTIFTWTTQEQVHRWMDHGSGTMRCKGQCGSGSLSPMIDNDFTHDNEDDKWQWRR